MLYSVSSTTTIDAPASSACFAKAFPLNDGPFNAKKIQPGAIARVSVETTGFDK